MQDLSIGKFRALQQCSTPKGTFTCLALDHRQNLRKVNPIFLSDAVLSKFKLDVTKKLACFATAILLDPEFSAGQAIANQVLPGEKGLVVALESTGYEGSNFARKTCILPEWSVEKTKRMGANMVKLLVYYNPKASTSSEIEDLISSVAELSQKYDIGLMIEPLTYSMDDKKMSDREKMDLIVDTARTLTKIPGVDLLKAELPVDKQEKDLTKISNACIELSIASSIPWILLSGSAPYEVFIQHAEIACKSGASGVAVGRAVWQECLNLDDEDRHSFLENTAKERLRKLNAVCSEFGKPWTDFFRCNVDLEWFKTY